MVFFYDGKMYCAPSGPLLQGPGGWDSHPQKTNWSRRLIIVFKVRLISSSIIIAK